MRGVCYWGDMHLGVMGHNRLHWYRTLGLGVRVLHQYFFQKDGGFAREMYRVDGVRSGWIAITALDILSLKGNQSPAVIPSRYYCFSLTVLDIINCRSKQSVIPVSADIRCN